MTSKKFENNNLPEKIDQEESAKKLAPEREELASEVIKDHSKSSTEALGEEIKDKAELLALMEKDSVDFKTVEDIEKATEKYGNIMDKWGVDVVLGWIPWWEVTSGIFSMLFFLHQWQKLPDGKKLPMIDVLKVFGLQLVDTVGTGAAKVMWAWVWAIGGGLIWTLFMPIVGTAVGAVVLGGLWYTWWSSLFDYFFKSNKWSANIFKKHCDTLKKEAQDRNNTALVQELTASSAKIEQKFSWSSLPEKKSVKVIPLPWDYAQAA